MDRMCQVASPRAPARSQAAFASQDQWEFSGRSRSRRCMSRLPGDWRRRRLPCRELRSRSVLSLGNHVATPLGNIEQENAALQDLAARALPRDLKCSFSPIAEARTVPQPQPVQLPARSANIAAECTSIAALASVTTAGSREALGAGRYFVR